MHDYILALSFRVFSYGFMIGMMSQAVAVKLGTMVGRYFHIENSTYCNWYVWITLATVTTSWAIDFYLTLHKDDLVVK